MIKDTLLVCCLILAFVLLYRIYVVSQKINNLEEKFIILDNFSQTLFNYISSTNDNQQKQSVQNVQPVQPSQTNPDVITYSNANNSESESDTESSEPEEKVDNKNIIESTENFETKEILSDMVSQLKESIILNNKETLSNELKEVDELKESLKENESEKSSNNLDVFNSPSNVTPVKTVVETTVVTDLSKKKEKDLQEMTMEKLKELAKKQNITITQGKKQKNKSELIKDLLASQ